MKSEKANEGLNPAEVQRIKEKIDLSDPSLLLQYGAGVQRKIASFSNQLLSLMGTQQVDLLSPMLEDLVEKVKSLPIEIAEDKESWLQSIPLLSKWFHPADAVLERYENLSFQIDGLQDKLEDIRMDLLRDIGVFDRMMEKNKQQISQLELFIQAGQEKVQESKQLASHPALSFVKDDDPMSKIQVRNQQAALSQLERKVHDLSLSKTIALQTSAQLNLLQSNHQKLVEKIQMATMETIPAWKAQMVMVVSLMKERKNLSMQEKLNRTNKQILQKHSKQIDHHQQALAKQEANHQIISQDLQKAQQDLLDTISQTLALQEQSKVNRAKTQGKLQALQAQLKE